MLGEIEVYNRDGFNFALASSGAKARQSSDWSPLYPASNAIDGFEEEFTHTKSELGNNRHLAYSPVA